MNNKALFTGWRTFLNESNKSVDMDEKIVKKAILTVLPHADIRFMRVIGSSTLDDHAYALHNMAKHGEIPDIAPDIDIQVEVTGISNEDAEKWATSKQADELEFTYNYDVQLRIVNKDDEPKVTKLRIFDFDDTLAITKEAVHVRDKRTDEIIKTITSQAELEEYSKLTDDVKGEYYLDFEEFTTVTDPEEIEDITNILKNVVSAEERDPQRIIMVLTARQQEAAEGIEEFLSDIGIDSKYIDIVGVGDRILEPGEQLSDIEKRERLVPAEERKVSKIRDILQANPSVREVLFFDDSVLNLAAVQKLNDTEYPDIKFILKKIAHTPQGLRVGRIQESAGQGEIQKKYARTWVNALSKLDMGGNKHRDTGMQKRRGRKSGSSPPGMAEATGDRVSDSVLVAIFGPSGCGKSRMKQAFKNMGFDEIKSFTTRGRRGGEDQDIEYDFRSLDDFLRQLQDGNLVNVNQYNNNWYGTPVETIEESQKAVLLTDISSLQHLNDVVTDLKKTILFVYCPAPPLKDLIARHRARLKSGEYKNQDEFKERLMTAVDEAESMDQLVTSLGQSLPIYDFEEAKKALGL